MRGDNSANSLLNISEDQDGGRGPGDADLTIAKTMLLVGRWMQQTGQAHHDTIISHFKTITALQPQYVSGFFLKVFNVFFDHLFERLFDVFYIFFCCWEKTFLKCFL